MEGRFNQGNVVVIYVPYINIELELIFGYILYNRLRYVSIIYPGSTCRK
jgi:hypothetical protein